MDQKSDLSSLNFLQKLGLVKNIAKAMYLISLAKIEFCYFDPDFVMFVEPLKHDYVFDYKHMWIQIKNMYS